MATTKKAQNTPEKATKSGKKPAEALTKGNTTSEAKKPVKTPEKTEKREEVKTMNKPAENKPAAAIEAAAKPAALTEAEAIKEAVINNPLRTVPVEGLNLEEIAKKAAEAPKTEKAIKPAEAAKPETMTPEAIKALYDASKTAATKDQRQAALEKFEAAREAFNASSLTEAVNRSSFLTAAEAYRPKPPKKDENKIAGIDYNRRAETVSYIVIDEEAKQNSRTMNLATYAREAFNRDIVTFEAKAARAAALTALDYFLKNHVEKESHEGLKAAAEALTRLCDICGLDKIAEKGGYPFFVDRSFILAMSVKMRANKGEFKTPAAAIEEATEALFNSTVNGRAKAEERLSKAEENATKALFNIICEAARAAIYGNWKATILTADEARARAKARAEEEARRAARRAEEAKARAAAAAIKAAARVEEAAAKLEEAKAKAAEKKAEAEALTA